ncbi:hypothetical protein GCM10023200_40740 [Actinomycetospora chlora]|uniref:Uncharacterized protein n=1 Tax=Actinomycetospora chlora TaxID=663608 RepID=A0ABP9BS43_9PSEU
MPDTSPAAIPPPRSRTVRLLVGGAVLTAAGGLLGAAGTGLVAAAAWGAARRWQQATAMTPAQLARHAVSATVVGAGAGAEAWRRPAGDLDLAAALATAADSARGIPAPRPGDDRVEVSR